MEKDSGFSRFSDFLGSVASRGTSLVVEKYKDIFRKKLKEGLKRITIKASIKYFIIFAGIFIVIFEPINFFISNLTASILFIGVLIWSILSCIKIIRGYYKLPYFIIKEKNLHNGTWKFISFKWPEVAKGITGYNLVKSIGCLFSDNFNKMPDVENTVKEFIRYVLKDIIIFCSFFILYFITVNIVVKPLLLMHFAGIHTWEIYLFPFVQIKDFISYFI